MYGTYLKLLDRNFVGGIGPTDGALTGVFIYLFIFN